MCTMLCTQKPIITKESVYKLASEYESTEVVNFLFLIWYSIASCSENHYQRGGEREGSGTYSITVVLKHFYFFLTYNKGNS